MVVTWSRHATTNGTHVPKRQKERGSRKGALVASGFQMDRKTYSAETATTANMARARRIAAFMVCVCVCDL